VVVVACTHRSGGGGGRDRRINVKKTRFKD
jgi:hypothetical protein